VIFQQLVNEDSGCLSYLIGCSEAGQAVVVDPGRDRVDEYLRVARKKGLRIAHILESTRPSATATRSGSATSSCASRTRRATRRIRSPSW